ncbi:MAG: hypothetical protein WEG40_06145 [Candidatus Rokuibacteriota bacterium]
MAVGKWGSAVLAGPALLIAMIAPAVADEPHAIWRSSVLAGSEWVSGWRTYVSKAACDQAVARRQARIAWTLERLRRIGADDVVLQAVGDRRYECRPAVDPAPSRSLRRDSQSP